MMTGLAFIPMMIFVSAGVDYGRILSAQTALQAAADSAALNIAQTGSNLTASQMQTQAQTLISAAFYNPSTSNMNVTISATGGAAKTYQLKATVDFQPSLLRIIGYNTIPISATVTSQAKSNARTRISLVLDNSGSMSQAGKMTALKGAANSFLTTMQSAASTAADVYISIIPFVDVVNVGSTNAAASWVDWSEWDSGSFWLSGWQRTSASNHASWGGCIADRGNSSGPASGAYDTNVSAPIAGNTATLFPASVPAACPVSVLPLTNDFTALSNEINGMAANGNTNQAIGFAHGWMSLVGGGPYPTPPVEQTGYVYKKYIIILSDGLNTVDRWYNNQSSIDARQLLTCTNIKAAGITIYSIQVNTGGDPTSSILQSCASDTTKFFQISSASQMPAIFSNIAGQINQLTLTN